MPDPQAERATRIRAAVCRHTDGLAVGTTVTALAERDAFKILTSRDRTPFGLLCEELDANPGFLRVALRLLADQGWVVFRGAPERDRLLIAATAAGKIVFTELADAYARAVDFHSAAARMAEILAGAADEPLREHVNLMRREWDLPVRDIPPAIRQQVLLHLNGHVVAPLMLALTQAGTVRPGVDVPLDTAPLRQAVGVLVWQRWAQTNGDSAWLTPDGELAVAFARQYRYPLVYLPLLRRVPRLIFGGPPPAVAAETQLDRELDVRFSGEVFNATCRRPFLAFALPLFRDGNFGEQPELVVDTGCGDGTALLALYAAVRAHTERGRNLEQHPLLMVGLDPSPVARQVTAARLAAAGVPHLVLDGDIADPDGIRRELGRHGLHADNALHICKSAIHDRDYREPAGNHGAADPPVSFSAFARPDGSDIPAVKIAHSLVELMHGWRSLTRRHGWLVIEGQATPAVVTARLLGRTVATSLDSTHGYSCQYPVEPRVFAWAARAAGFVSRRHAEPGAAQLGHAALTVDHFVVDAESA